MSEKQFIPLNIAVLTVSDTRDASNDKSGDLLAERISSAGHNLVERAISKDSKEEIADQILAWTSKADAIITTGGTGLTGRDVTPEALEPLFDKRIEGFSVLFHQISATKIGTSTLQSRATAGLIQNCFVFCVPGSPNACRDAWDEILAYQLDHGHKPCNFVDIMPRLNEK